MQYLGTFIMLASLSSSIYPSNYSVAVATRRLQEARRWEQNIRDLERKSRNRQDYATEYRKTVTLCRKRYFKEIKI